MKKVLIYFFFCVTIVVGISISSKAFATGYCPGYSSASGIAQCYCYPLSVTATTNSNQCSATGKIQSVTVNWNGANCSYCAYILTWTDGGQPQSKTWTNSCPDNKSDPIYANNQTTITGSDITGPIGVAPSLQSNQVTSDTPAVCTAPTTTGPTTPPTVPPTQGPASINVSLVVGLQGIGTFGTTPNDAPRSVTVELYDAASTAKPGGVGSTVLGSGTGQISYDSGTDNNVGYFVAKTPIKVTLTKTATNDQYVILVKVPQYLYALGVNDTSAQNPHTYTIHVGDTITTTPITLFPGDIVTANGGANSISLDDYTALLTCYSSHDITSSSCPKTADGIAYADLDDNGKIDIVDFNIWLRSVFQLQNSNTNPPVCSNGACVGD